MAKPTTAAPRRGTGLRKKKTRKTVPTGVFHVKSTFNNTMVTVTDPTGGAVCWSTAGACGYKGSKKSTPFAAQEAASKAAKDAQTYGMQQAVVLVRGPGSGREAAVRAIAAAGIKVTLIRDITPVPHNGCRPPKRRRV